MHTELRKKVAEVNKFTDKSTGEKRMLVFDYFLKNQELEWGTFRAFQDEIVNAISFLSETAQSEPAVATLTFVYELLGELEIMRTEIK